MSDWVSISPDESLHFAELSGDFNPLHVDPIGARRLPFGGTVAHGISVVMRALDIAVSHHGGGAIASLNAQFDSPISTGEKFKVDAERKADELAVCIRTEEGVAQRMTAHLVPAMAGPQTVADYGERRCRNLDFEAAAESSGSLPFAWNAALGEKLYPALSRSAPVWQLSALCATTRLVGMECPGLHSVYTSLDIAFSDGDTRDDRINWRVAKVDKRFRLLRLEVEAASFSARIDAVMRPPPVLQPSFADVRSAAAVGIFSGRRVVVVGGSRGLGEVAAKIFAAGGGEILITYATGVGDAAAVADEINAGGGLARICAFDVLNPSTSRPADLPAGWVPTDLAYFASPQITLAPGAPWNEALFQRFCSYFVGGFANTVAALDQGFGTAKKPLRIFYPSTIYVAKPPPGGAEYAASKGAAEAYCEFLQLRRPNTSIVAPRLPRMLTDQTSSVRSGPMERPLPVLLRHLI